MELLLYTVTFKKNMNKLIQVNAFILKQDKSLKRINSVFFNAHNK